MAKDSRQGNPAQEDEAFKWACRRWLAQEHPKTAIQRAVSSQEIATVMPKRMPSTYRLPVPGERVLVRGLQKRAEYNGACGEISSRGPDEQGRFTISLVSGLRTTGSVKKLKVHCSHLLPYEELPGPHLPRIKIDRSTIMLPPIDS
mmetsp:Transcript_51180/g.121647  ORF Transcript_51180/g.121647 Transcript_51180/m.121647 type:complete len:146 (+) Transcript_51180:123-560(+)